MAVSRRCERDVQGGTASGLESSMDTGFRRGLGRCLGRAGSRHSLTLGKPMINLSRSLLAWLLALAPISAIAQDQGTADERQACEPDVNRLCSEFIPDRSKIIICLNQKVRQLNPACRNVILFYAQQQICAGDSSRLCGEFAQDREKTLACLSGKRETLTASCRRALAVYERERR
jgi:hypothetical protein